MVAPSQDKMGPWTGCVSTAPANQGTNEKLEEVIHFLELLHSQNTAGRTPCCHCLVRDGPALICMCWGEGPVSFPGLSP